MKRLVCEVYIFAMHILLHDAHAWHTHSTAYPTQTWPSSAKGVLGVFSWEDLREGRGKALLRELRRGEEILGPILFFFASGTSANGCVGVELVFALFSSTIGSFVSGDFRLLTPILLGALIVRRDILQQSMNVQKRQIVHAIERSNNFPQFGNFLNVVLETSSPVTGVSLLTWQYSICTHRVHFLFNLSALSAFYSQK